MKFVFRKGKKVISLLLAVIMIVGVLPTAAMAAEVPAKGEEVISPRAGTETLPYGWYDIGTFSFTGGGNLTPVKTVAGRYLSLEIAYQQSSKDHNGNPIKLTIKIKDYNTGNIIATRDWGTVGGGTYITAHKEKFDLGRTGRKVQIWFILSTPGVSSAPDRTVDIIGFKSYVE